MGGAWPAGPTETSESGSTTRTGRRHSAAGVVLCCLVTPTPLGRTVDLTDVVTARPSRA